MKMKRPFLFICYSVLILTNCNFSTDRSLGTIYYIDSENGQDTNSGTDAGQAWRSLNKVNSTVFQPGDHILFRVGCQWKGQLWPKGSGKKGNPIMIDMYGKGEKPLIMGDGEFQETVKLCNQEYWEIKNLEITNFREGDDPYDPDNLKRGIYVLARDAGAIHHIQLSKLHVHHVNGILEPDFPAKNNGGIYFEVLGNSVKTWFDDFLIDGCYIHDVDRTGISNKSSWWTRTVDDDMGWVPSHDVVIRNTTVERAAYNAVIVRCTDNALVEYCIFKNNGIKGNGNAIFSYNTDNTTIQYCEAYGTVHQPGTSDAAGFDADCYNKNTTIQYNYSHDNGLGGIVMVAGDGKTPFNIGTVIRYNLLQNSQKEGIRVSGFPAYAKIYNNIIYIDSLQTSVNIIYHKYWKNWPSNIDYYNNIIYNLSKNSYYSLGLSKNIEFSHNVFFGNSGNREPDDPFKMIQNPMFVDPGSGDVGRETVEGYKLRSDSPCIDSGMLIEDHGGRDFWGNSVPVNGSPDCGIHEYNLQNSLKGSDNSERNEINEFALNNFPNPFNPFTVIAYQLSQPANMSIKIYNVIGQKIKTLFDGYQSNRVGQIIWDATDDVGQSVPAGVYVYTLIAGGIRINRKMLLAENSVIGSSQNN